jgi:hypothetical protein
LKTVIRFTVVAFAIMLVTAVGHPGRAVAQAPNLAGNYTLDAGASQSIKAAVDKVAEQMSFLIRGIVKDRLMAANPPVNTVAIVLAGNDATITWNGNMTVKTPTDGTPVDWTAPDGEKGKLSTVWAGPVLKRTLTSGNGQRGNAYSLDPSGKVLTLEVTISSSQLPAPVNYKLVFRRNG